MPLAHLPEVYANGALQLLEADFDQVLDGVRVIESQGVGLRLVLLSLQQMVLQLQEERRHAIKQSIGDVK